MKKKKTVYDLLQEGKKLTKKCEDAFMAENEIIIERNKKIEDFTKKLDEELDPKRIENNQLGLGYRQKSCKVLAKANKVKIPWEKAIEYMIDALKEIEGKTYQLVATDDEWHKFEDGERPCYERIYIVYLKEENVKLLNRLNDRVENNPILDNFLEGTFDSMKKKDGVVVLYIQRCYYFKDEKKPLVIPKNFVFGKRIEVNEISLNDILVGKHEYLIEEIAKKIELK